VVIDRNGRFDGSRLGRLDEATLEVEMHVTLREGDRIPAAPGASPSHKRRSLSTRRANRFGPSSTQKTSTSSSALSPKSSKKTSGWRVLQDLP
jgi:hypothetical protein